MAKKRNIRSLIAPIRSPKEVRREIGAATRLEFRPVARQIRGEKRASRQMSRNIKGWYGQQRRQLGNLRSQGLATQANLAGQMAAEQTRLDAADAARQDALVEEERRSAAIRGTAPDTSSLAAANAAAAGRRNIIASNVGRAAAQAQANANVLGQINAAATLGRNALLREEQARRQNANADLRELQQRKGDFRVDYRGKLRQAERDWWLQRKTLGSKADYNDAIRDVAAMGLARGQASADATKYAADTYTQGKIRTAKIYGKDRKGKPIRGSDLNRAGSYLRATLGKSGKDWRYVKQHENAAIDSLVNRGVDPVTARMAVRRFVKRKQKKIGHARIPSPGVGVGGTGSAGTE